VELIDRRLLDEAPHDGRMTADEKRNRIADLVNDAKIEAQHHRSAVGPHEMSWTDLRDFYSGIGQNWDVVSPGLPDYLQGDWSITNHVKAACQIFTATIVNALPTWYVVEMGTGEEDEASARVTTYLRAWQQFVAYDAAEKACVTDALQVGMGVMKAYWDKHRGKSGEVVVDAVRPENVFPDPTATRIEECSFIAVRNLYGIERALRLWPDLDLTKVTMSHGEEDEFAGESHVNETRAAQTVVVWEVYYDFGERLMIYSGEQTLFDGDSPVPKSDVLPHRYPLHFYEFEPRADCFWPCGLVQELVDPQNRINKTNTRIGIWHRLQVSPTWTTTSQAAKDTFDKSPGAVNYHDPESLLQPQYPPPIPADVFTYLEGAKGDLDNISGSVEVTRGLRPTGVNTGIALQVLHEAAQQRMTGPAASWTYSKAQLGQRVVELMMEHYSDDRALAIVEQGAAAQVGLTAEDMSREEPTGNFIEEFDETTGRYEQIPEMETVPRQYIVITQPGGDIPMSASARAEMAIQLKQLPSSLVQPTVIDDEACLDALQFPGRDRILERRDAQMQAAMEGEQAAMAQQQTAQQAQMAMQQMQVIAAQLREQLPEDMFRLLQGIMAGTVADRELIEQFMAAIEELGPDVASLVQQFMALQQHLTQMEQGAAPAGQGQPPQMSMV
jgi:hypothetical protein